MAVVAISDSNLRRADMEGAGPTATNIGGGAASGAYSEGVYQGSQAWGRRIGAINVERGFYVTITSTDMTVAGDEVVMYKVWLVNSSDIDSIANTGGMRSRIGSITSAYYRYILFDDGGQGDIDYPIKGGFVIVPINPNVVAWRDGVQGSPSLTGITEIGITGAVVATTRNENVILDAVDIGPGLWLVGGDSTDPDGTWQDFIDDDEGSVTAGRFGHVSTQEGVIFVFGTLGIGENASGTTTATVFNDANRTLVFPGGRVDTGWNRILVDIGNASTDVDFATSTFIGRGRSGLKHFFSSAGDVDGTNNEIDIVGHGLSTGDLVLYSDEGGTAITGLTDNTQYFVRAVTADAIALYAVGATVGRQNSYTDTSRLGLTAAGTGENHLLTLEPVTKPDLTIEGTSGAFDAISCTFDQFNVVTGTSAATWTNCLFLGLEEFALTGGSIDGCTFQESILEEGEALVVDTTLANITDCTFIADGRGSAIRVTAAGTYALDGNVFTGYGPNREQFDTETDVTGGATDTIGITGQPWTTGDWVFYNDEGGTETPGPTDGNKYYVNSVDANTVSLHLTREDAVSDTNRVNLTASAGGSGETHSLYDGRAAIVNSSGGAVTVQVTNGASPTIRNTPGSTTTVTNNIQITLTGMKDNTEVRVYDPPGSTTEIAGIENATAGTADDRSFSFSTAAGNVVDIRIFNTTHVTVQITNFTIPNDPTSIPVFQSTDRNYKNP